MATFLIILQLLVVLAMIFIGAKVGSIGLGIYGMVGVFIHHAYRQICHQSLLPTRRLHHHLCLHRHRLPDRQPCVGINSYPCYIPKAEHVHRAPPFCLIRRVTELFARGKGGERRVLRNGKLSGVDKIRKSLSIIKLRKSFGKLCSTI